MRVAFITDLDSNHLKHWNDGLKAALDFLISSYKWQIDIFNIQDKPQLTQSQIDSYDFGLYWGAFNTPQHKKKIFSKSGLCFAGGPTRSEFASNFDIIFAESMVDLNDFKRQGLNTLKAFGTNTKLFKPINTPKVFDWLYPAAFAKWKRHDLFVEHVRRRRGPAIAVGYIQPNNHEYECVQICLDNGVGVLPWIPPEALVWLYNQSKCVVVPSDPIGGGQRTVLESIACGTKVITLNPNHEKLNELKDLTREEVLTNWSEIVYAESLKQGIESVVYGNKNNIQT